MTKRPQVRVSVGVLAHDEEYLIGRVVAAYLAQQTLVARIVEIIVVSCDSSDATDLIVRQMMSDEPRLQIISRARREGKLGAIRTFVDVAQGDVLVISGGDTVPSHTAVEHLVAPFAVDSSCGMTGAWAFPPPAGGSLVVRLHRVLWQLHHEMAQRVPKLGEMVAIRAGYLHREWPSHVHCDEVLLEALVTEDRAQLRYVPEARVTNFPPETIAELFRQRRRIACQHLAAWYNLRYKPASNQVRPLAVTLSNAVLRRPRELPVIVALCCIEIAARVVGRTDYVRGERYRTWTLVSRPNPTANGPGER